MQTYRGAIVTLVRKPSAFIPLILSAGALLLLLGWLSIYGVREMEAAQDEGAAAHLYQLMIGGQLFVIAWFMFRWARHDLKAGVTILALQALAILASFIPLYILEH
jgi:hypothetical protein